MDIRMINNFEDSALNKYMNEPILKQYVSSDRKKFIGIGKEILNKKESFSNEQGQSIIDSP